MMQVISGVYLIKCLAENKVYVGSSSNIQLRWLQHKYRLELNNHHSKKLQLAWNTHGEQSFEFVIAETVLEKSILRQTEKLYIQEYNSYLNGYNAATITLRSSSSRRIKKMVLDNTEKGMFQSQEGNLASYVHADIIGICGRMVCEFDETVDSESGASPKMVKISFAVPEEIHKQMIEISASEGWKPAELCRLAWVMGMNAYAEGSNKRLVNQNLRNKSSRSGLSI